MHICNYFENRRHILKKNNHLTKLKKKNQQKTKTIHCIKIHALPPVAEDSHSELQGLKQLHQRKITIYIGSLLSMQFIKNYCDYCHTSVKKNLQFVTLSLILYKNYN